uniref:Centrosomal protein of 57 kDa-like n=1 Tax=Phallusia mammillata TaxID=59560 RepID=A0A6F9D8C2_9ASCI|nr:centrosomal protein of 57 kDa-like [Phallusia mammillata]
MAMTTSLFDDPSLPSFQEYPTSRPFLNSDIKTTPGKPVKAFPESSSQAVLSALKGLQEKIYNLELDRSKAEKNLKDLAAETSAYKDVLTKSQQTPPRTWDQTTSFNGQVGRPLSSQHKPHKDTSEVETQLRNADTRCRLLERQLENMRKMVQVAEKERGDALERQVALERERGKITSENRDAQTRLTKLEKLHNRYEDLATRKAKSDAKVKDLEDKLQLEAHQRKLLSDKAAQFQTEAQAKRILMQDEIPVRDVPRPKKSQAKKKKKKPALVAKETAKPAASHSQAGQPHYRLNLADVPFITGKSASPSHSVTANMQKLLHGLKHHSPIYCNEQFLSAGAKDFSSDDDDISVSSENEVRGRKAKLKKVSKPSATEEDLSDLLIALQDEFGKMTFDHQVLAKQISLTHDPTLRQEIEMELDSLVHKMELKGDQISTVRRHRAKLQEARRKKKKKLQQQKAVPRRASSVPGGGGKARSQVKFGSVHNSPRSAVPAGEIRNRRLALLKDVKSVHSALRKDDLSWD